MTRPGGCPHQRTCEACGRRNRTSGAACLWCDAPLPACTQCNPTAGAQPTKGRLRWSRFDTGSYLGYDAGRAKIFDNGGGMGRSTGSGRWAVEIDGAWIANVDTLAEAKTLADEKLPGRREAW